MIRLFVNSYRDPDPVRDAELQEAAKRNRANRAIGAVHSIDGRPTFGELFRQANVASEPGDLLIFANSDIYFDGTLGKIVDHFGVDHAYALTRWERMERGVSVFCDEEGPRCDSQDAWIFQSPIRQKLIDTATFTPGVRGCDNHLAYLMDRAGYDVRNPSQNVRAIHLHQSEVRRYSHNMKDSIPAPYLLIHPHSFWQTPRKIFQL